MTTKNTGGPAFHTPVSKPLENYYTGMTLRDYFAAKAMQAMVPDMETAGRLALAGEDPNSTIRTICKGAYVIADTMLAERERTE